MNRLHSMSETLQQSEDEAVQAAQEAVDRAAKEGAAAVTTRAREKDGGKAARGRQGEEQGEQEEEEDEGVADLNAVFVKVGENVDIEFFQVHPPFRKALSHAPTKPRAGLGEFEGTFISGTEGSQERGGGGYWPRQM